LRETLTKYISRLELVPVDYLPGTTPGIFPVKDFIVGDVICFEVAYGRQIRETIAQGATIIAVQTNNATYGNTEQPEQQFAITRFRAIEHQRPFVVASTSGISGLIDHNGNVLQQTGEFQPATVSGEVATVSDLPITDRVPMWSALIGVVGFLTMLVLEFLRSKSRLRRPTHRID
jgi:apolipoprotein N-acyltransferase